MAPIGDILREIPRNFWIILQELGEKETRLKEFQRNFLCTSLLQVELKRIGRYLKQRNADREYIKKRFSKIRDDEGKLQKARGVISKKYLNVAQTACISSKISLRKLNLRFTRVARLPARRKTEIVKSADQELRKFKQTYEAMKLSTEEIVAKLEIDKTDKCQKAIAEDVPKASKSEKECPDVDDKDKTEVFHLKPLVCTNVRQQLKECRDMLEATDIQKLLEEIGNLPKEPKENPPNLKNSSSSLNCVTEKDVPVVRKRINRNSVAPSTKPQRVNFPENKLSVAPSTKPQRVNFPENKLAPRNTTRNRLVQRTLLNRNVAGPSAKTHLKGFKQGNCPDNGNLHPQPKRNNVRRMQQKFKLSNELQGLLRDNRANQHVTKLETEKPTSSNACRGAIKRKMYTIPEETEETQSDVEKSLSRPRKQPKLVNSSLFESMIKDSFSNICKANERKDHLLSRNPDNYSTPNPFFNSNPEDLQNDIFSIPGTLENALSNIYDTSMAQMKCSRVENPEKPPLTAAMFTRTVPSGVSSVSETFATKDAVNRDNSDAESLNSFETAKTVIRNSPKMDYNGVVPYRHEKKPDNKCEAFDLTMFEDMWSSMLNDSETFRVDEMSQDSRPLNEDVFSGNLNFANPTLFSDSESEKTQ